MFDNSYMSFRIPHRAIKNFIRTIWAIPVLIFAVLMMTWSNPSGAAGLSLKDVLPTEGFAKDWVIEEKVKLFDKDTLFDHINGEAELYFPYGFDALATANYLNKKNQELAVTADVYQMASVLDAFGIYSNYRKTNNLWVTIGVEGFVSASQLMFYQDRYFVRLQVSGTTSLPKEIFLALARIISGKLPAGSGPPKELEVLKIQALVPKSERYLAKSLLGYAFFRRGLIADASLQDQKMQIFAIAEDNPAAARRTFDQYCSYLKAEAKDVQLTGNTARKRVAAVDPLYGGVLVEQTGHYVIGAVRIKNNSAAGQVIEQLYRQVNAGTGG
jgi:hypothetical protein